MSVMTILGTTLQYLGVRHLCIQELVSWSVFSPNSSLRSSMYEFPLHIKVLLVASCLPIYCVCFCLLVPAADFPRLKRPFHEADHSPPCNAEFRNNVELHLSSQFVFDLNDAFQCMFKNAQIYPPPFFSCGAAAQCGPRPPHS